MGAPDGPSLCHALFALFGRAGSECLMLRNNASGRTSGFRAGFRPDSNRESLKIGSPAGRRPAGEPIFRSSRLNFRHNPARKPPFLPGSTTAYHRIHSKIIPLGAPAAPFWKPTLYWSIKVPASFRFWGVRPGSGGRYFVRFSSVVRPLRPPRRGAAAGGAVLPQKNQRYIDPRAPAGPPRKIN